MGILKKSLHDAFSAISEFILEAEGANLVDCQNGNYNIREEAETFSSAQCVIMLEQMIYKLRDIIAALKEEREDAPSSVSQPLPTVENFSDNDSSEETLENAGDEGAGNLDSQKALLTPTSTTLGLVSEDNKPSLGRTAQPLQNLVTVTEAELIIPDITSSSCAILPTTVLPASMNTTFSSTSIQQNSHIPDMTDTTSVIGIQQSATDKGFGSSIHTAKCIKCNGEFPVDGEQTSCSVFDNRIPYICPHCCSISESVSRRRRKQVPVGGSVTNSSNSLESKSSEPPGRKHACAKCGRKFSKWKHLSIHFTKVHLDEDGAETCADIENPDLMGSNTLPLFSCKTCNMACVSMQRFNTHTCRLPTDEENTASTLSNRILITNVLKLHKLRKFVCEMCGVEYRTFKRITYHLPRCSPGPYPCNVCATLFNSQKELNYHKRKQHKDEKCFVCEECGKSFQRRASLQKHAINWHESSTAMGPFKCEMCPKKFIRRIYLTNHKLRMHGMNKKFLCQVCGNKFMTQNSLMAHMQVHSDVKKFECSFCKKKFKRKEKLLYHERIHTGERPFQCQQCVRGFVSKTKLAEHMSRHRGDRRYRCSYCTKTYAGAWDLKQHIRKVHDKQCEKVSVTILGNSQSNNNTTTLPQVQILDPLALATAASGLKEEEGGTCSRGISSLTQVAASTSSSMEEVGGTMVGGPQYITVNGQQAVTIPVVGGMQAHIPPIGHVVQVSGSSVPLTGVSSNLGSGGTSVQTVQTVQTVQAVQAVQTIPGVTTTEYSVQTLPPQAVHATQGYIFAQGFDMVSGTLQY